MIDAEAAKAKCMRVEEGSYHAGDTGAGRAYYHDLSERRYILPNNFERTAKTASERKPPEHWEAKYDQLSKNNPRLHELSEMLGLTTDSLAAVGYVYDVTESCWAQPERGADERIIGLTKRYANHKKYCYRGSRRGLVIPRDWSSRDTVYIVEGPTDTAAILDLGHMAIGRPSNTAGVGLIHNLMAEYPGQLVFVIEFDTKDCVCQSKEQCICRCDCRWQSKKFCHLCAPGLVGANESAMKLANLLGTTVYTMCAGICKDAREFLNKGNYLNLASLTYQIGKGFDADILEICPSGRGKIWPHMERNAINPDVVKTAQEPPGRNVSIGQARKLTSEVVMKSDGHELVSPPTGSSKTTVAIDRIRQEGSGTLVLPTHANCQEVACDTGFVPYPNLTENNCKNIAEAKKVIAMGLDIAPVLCFSICPYREGCQYRAAIDAANGASCKIMTHERFRRSPNKATGVVFVDEECLASTITIVLDENPKRCAMKRIHGVFHEVESFLLARSRQPTSQLLTIAKAAQNLLYKLRCDNLWARESRLATPREMPRPLDLTDHVSLFEALTKCPAYDRTHFRAVLDLLAGKIRQVSVVVHRIIDKKTGNVNLKREIQFDWELPGSDAIRLDATGNAEILSQMAATEIQPTLPNIRTDNIHTVTQYTSQEVTRGASLQSPRTAAGWIRRLILESDAERVCVMTYKHLIEGGKIRGILEPQITARIAKCIYYGEGIDRGSNQVHTECDRLVIVGTDQPGEERVRRFLCTLGHHVEADYAPGWVDLDWTAFSGQVVRTKGYANPIWRKIHNHIVRSSMMQRIGRARSNLNAGIPVDVVSSADLDSSLTLDDRQTPLKLSSKQLELVTALASLNSSRAHTSHIKSYRDRALLTTCELAEISGLGKRAIQKTVIQLPYVTKLANNRYEVTDGRQSTSDSFQDLISLGEVHIDKLATALSISDSTARRRLRKAGFTKVKGEKGVYSRL